MTSFFIAVGVLSGLCGLLAALLVLADRFVNNYGPCTITINDGDKTLSVNGGDTLLSILSDEEIFIPSACGGRGSCGLCKLKITAGAGPLLPTEEPHLSKEEIANHVRLSCQVKVRENMTIVIPEELFAIRQYQAIAKEIRDLTWDIKLLRLELLEPETIDIIPGQYIQLQTPVYGKHPEPVYRAYSIASGPRLKRQIDLIIRKVPDGICTTWVFDHLKQGDPVIFNGPYGDFHLSDTNRDMIFIGGGSGMAPFCSILDHMANSANTRKATYFFGARSKQDLFYLDEMAEFEQKLPNVTFVPALSAPLPEDNWTGESGLITDVVDRHCQDCANKEAYLCGSPGMIDACIAVLTKHGMPEDQIFYDKFG